MKDRYDPKCIVIGDYATQEHYLKEKEEIEFNIGQSYEETPARTLICKYCGGEEFKVGQGDYFTAIKCIKCEYEVCIHDG